MAADGEEGLAAASGSDYDVIVLDIMLPKLDGLAFSGSVKASFLLRARMPLHDRTLTRDAARRYPGQGQ